MTSNSTNVPIPLSISVRHLTPIYLTPSDPSVSSEMWKEREEEVPEPTRLTNHHRKRRLHSSTAYSGMYPSFQSFLPIRMDLVVPSQYWNSLVSSQDHPPYGEESSTWVILASYCNDNAQSTCNVVWDHVDEMLYDAIESTLRENNHSVSATVDQPCLEIEEEQRIQNIWMGLYPHLWVRVSVSQHPCSTRLENDIDDIDDDIHDDVDPLYTLFQTPIMEIQTQNRKQHEEHVFVPPLSHKHIPMIPLCAIPLYPPRLCPIVLHDSNIEDGCVFPDRIPPNSIYVLYSDGMTRGNSTIIQSQEDDASSSCHHPTQRRQGDDTPTECQTYPNNPLLQSDKTLWEISRYPDKTLWETHKYRCGTRRFSYKPSGKEDADVKFMHSTKNHGVLDDDDEENDFLLRAEIELLEAELYREQQTFREDKELLQMKCQQINSLRLETDRVQDETKDLQRRLEEMGPMVDKKYRVLHKKKIKLVSDLRSIYPIQHFPDQIYIIGGIHLPSDLDSLVSSDEMISSALGYICHIVFMCSKYLNIPLRYRLIFNSSRSAIQDDTQCIFPLFKDPMVDREQMDIGLTLLHCNVDLLFTMSGLPVMAHDAHILSKVESLLSGVCAWGIDERDDDDDEVGTK